MSKFKVIVGLAILLAVSSTVVGVSAESNTQTANNDQLVGNMFPNVIGNQTASDDMEANNRSLWLTETMADAWKMMSKQGKDSLIMIANNTDELWKQYPDAAKMDVVNDVVYYLNKGKPFTPTAVVANEKTYAEFQALDENDKALVLTAFNAAIQLVVPKKPA